MAGVLIAPAAAMSGLPSVGGPGSSRFATSVTVDDVMRGVDIVVPAGLTLTTQGSLRVEAVNSILILGSIQAAQGASIDLVAGQVVRLEGSIAAGDGGAGSASTTSVPASAGANGGDIDIDAPLVFFGAASRIATGLGGRGGHAVVHASGDGPVTAVAGAGGRGGDMTVKAVSMLGFPQLALGNGGRGGDATAVGANDAPAVAHSGPGGRSGRITLPAGEMSDAPLVSAWSAAADLVGGIGGDGGLAIAVIDNPPETQEAMHGMPGADDSEDARLAAYPAKPLTPTTPGGDALAGTSGQSAVAHAYRGGSGLMSGGRGGDAQAYGGYAGSGGDGAEGFMRSACGGLLSPPCQKISGGVGGRGGRGGDASAYGGAGGDSKVQPGRGGDALAVATDGAPGGSGGRGGWIVVTKYEFLPPAEKAYLGCLKEGADGGPLPLLRVDQAFVIIGLAQCALGFIVDTNHEVVCGSAGLGGEGGGRGYGYALGGRGGSRLGADVPQLDGEPGQGTATDGSPGDKGHDGARASYIEPWDFVFRRDVCDPFANIV